MSACKNKAYTKAVLPLFSSSAEGIDVQDTSIDIDRLSFSYGDKKIFESLDLHVEKGEKLAVLGSSGSGKSTLYELLRGGLVPDSGAVCIGGADVRALSAECLGRLIATVDPFDKLLSGSIEENILPAENRDTFVVQEEIQRAGLNKMVNDLPQGVNTLLNCGGTGLSETERLKLIFARATARKAPVVLLDGVLDTADNKTRKRFTDALLSLPSTVIVFTAREEVAKCFSSALRLPDGKI